MRINTKFNFKDKVFKIWFSNIKEWVPCGFCGGLGIIYGKDNVKKSCPECYDRKGSYTIKGKEWSVDCTLTIGEVRVEKRCKYADKYSDFSNYGSQDKSYKEQYMCYETGIGSGTMWPVDVLFKTSDEAQAECDKRNKK